MLENTTGVLNDRGYFQFKPEVDVSGGTFQTVVQIENNFINTDINDKSCVCEGTGWGKWHDITLCPDRNDYIKSDNAFRKTQRRFMFKQMYPGMICPTEQRIIEEQRELACPRDCSGSYVNDSICRDDLNLRITCNGMTGKVQGTIINTFKVLKSRLDGKDGKDDNNIQIIKGLSCPFSPDTQEPCEISC